ncbi:MAG TPA: PQQ-dependent sugar dehydrogenase [Gemmatimonadaceae bacterium]|nr:PQQ-dependent sugar dehydrogenase [Gemmatimonadaceae bacterium]
MTHAPWRGLLASLLAALGACGGGSIAPPPLPTAVTMREVASGLSNPLHLVSPAGDPRLFIVEQPGRIRIVKDGVLLAAPFLDIATRVTSGGERGLLSMAFHPAYAQNGFFYVNYTGAGGTTYVERFSVSTDPEVADPQSALLILEQSQPFPNHNGGHILFGPDDMLYIAMGDGGDGGDPLGHGQNRNTLLGALLRLDVDGGTPYAIPSDNPFAGEAGARDEIWAYGLRNPWRIAFDAPSGNLYVADVGQSRLEEVNVVAAAAPGVNYGWNIMEGNECYPQATNCDTSGLMLPVLVYPHEGGACSITGGHVYRGSELPDIVGHYFYADYCLGFIRSFRYAGGAATQQRDWPFAALVGRVLSFGVDAAGELYVLSQSGRVFRLSKADEAE